jgi:hypothetical protein
MYPAPEGALMVNRHGEVRRPGGQNCAFVIDRKSRRSHYVDRPLKLHPLKQIAITLLTARCSMSWIIGLLIAHANPGHAAGETRRSFVSGASKSCYSAKAANRPRAASASISPRNAALHALSAAETALIVHGKIGCLQYA